MTSFLLYSMMALPFLGGVIYLFRQVKGFGRLTAINDIQDDEIEASSKARDVDIHVDKLTDKEKLDWLEKQL